MSQLDLFLHTKPTRQIFHFPSDRRVTFAHAVAQRLDALDYDGGKKLWQDVCRDVRQGLRTEGLTTSEIKVSIDQLADDVHASLKRLAILKQYRPQAVILSLRPDLDSNYPHGDGVGVAGTLGQGTKFLAGLGGAHERTEYDATRAHDGGAA